MVLRHAVEAALLNCAENDYHRPLLERLDRPTQSLTDWPKVSARPRASPEESESALAELARVLQDSADTPR